MRNRMLSKDGVTQGVVKQGFIEFLASLRIRYSGSYSISLLAHSSLNLLDRPLSVFGYQWVVALAEYFELRELF